MKININQAVMFTLTDYGLWLLMKKRICQAEDISKVNVDYSQMAKMSKHKQTMQLWQVMEIFGEHLFNGSENIFVDNILEIDEVGV